MNNDDSKRPEADAELEREVRNERKFTLAEAIGRLAGPGALKGESPVSRSQQAEAEIDSWLRVHLVDTAGALRIVLLRYVKASELLLNEMDRPLAVLAGCCEQVLRSDYLLEEFVRDTDVEWGRTMDERPHFEKKGTPPDPDDPYTVASVRDALSALLKELGIAQG